MTEPTSPNLLPSEEINIFWRSDGEYAPSHVSELSRTGAFISTSYPVAVGKILSLRLSVPGREIRAQAVVRRVLPGRGMGIEFESMSADDRSCLHLLVREIELELLTEAGRTPAALPSDASRDVDSMRASGLLPTGWGKRGAERRARVRHRFIATAELTPSGSAEPVVASLGDLAKGGCYVTTPEPLTLGTDLNISVAAHGQLFHAWAKVVSVRPGKGMGLAFTEIGPTERLVLDTWLATSMERTWLASNRRRSQRIMVNIPVQVASKNSFGTKISEDTKTVSVSAHGALLRLEMDVAKGQTIVLRNSVTNNALECSVDYLGATHEGLREVGVSFVVPNQTLWQISFPPSDWSPQHPDAKRT